MERLPLHTIHSEITLMLDVWKNFNDLLTTRTLIETKDADFTQIRTVQSWRMSLLAFVASMKGLVPERSSPKIVHELILCRPNFRILDSANQLGLAQDELSRRFLLVSGLS